MPTYDYRCDECGDEFEVWQSIKDDTLTECHRCGGSLRKVMSAAGIVLKGSGFYKTDNRRARGGDEGDGKSKSDGEKKSDGDKKSDGEKKSEKSDTKSEKKSEKSDTKAASGSKD